MYRKKGVFWVVTGLGVRGLPSTPNPVTTQNKPFFLYITESPNRGSGGCTPLLLGFESVQSGGGRGLSNL